MSEDGTFSSLKAVAQMLDPDDLSVMVSGWLFAGGQQFAKVVLDGDAVIEPHQPDNTGATMGFDLLYQGRVIQVTVSLLPEGAKRL